jgi:histidyl-tRNA synthetase
VSKIQAIRGMNDILPHETAVWQKVESIFRAIAKVYAYHEIRLPIMEKTALFKRSIGEATDIVEKEMYTFFDRNEESLTLRPEGTASCVRAVIEHGLSYHQIQKLWYMGPMFRYERPQKGRYRQFYHVGVEAFGLEGHAIEVELILMTARFWQALNISQKVNLQVNCLGSTEARAKYREVLVNYFNRHKEGLDQDSLRRLETNPLRILDSKNPAMAEILSQAPVLKDFLDEASRLQFEKFCEHLSALHIPFEINPRLVRGLDYYTGMVFEWITPHLGAQSAVCAGGRYDGLVAQLGGEQTSAVGFAMGMERVLALCEMPKEKTPPDIYFIAQEKVEIAALTIAEAVRSTFPTLSVEIDYLKGSFKSQFKRADKSSARFALILGEDEADKNVVIFKNLRENIPQAVLAVDELMAHIRGMIGE